MRTPSIDRPLQGWLMRVVICAFLIGVVLTVALAAVRGAGAAPKPNKNAPHANNGSVSTNEDVAVLITLVATDPNGDALSYQITSLPTHGKLYKGNSTAAADEITSTSLPFTLPNSGNQVKYVPNANYNNTLTNPDTFRFQAKDRRRTSNTATISIRVDPVNDAPVANNDSATVAEGGTVSGNVLSNDTDVDGDALEAVLVSGPAHASSFTLNADGSFSYTHDGSETASDSFTYKANDGTADSNIATVNITVNPVNDAPVANNDAYSVNEGGTLNVAKPGLLGNDTDPENNTLTAVLVSGPSNASSFSLNGDGSFTYVHDGSETTSDSFTYKANDGSADSNVATVNITVNPVNDAPTFTAGGNVTVYEDSGAYSAAWATAISAGPNEGGQNVSFVVTNNNDALFSVQPAISPSGTLTFTPAPNAFGTATVTVFAQDDGGTANGGDDTSPSQTFTITVNAVNDPPSFNLGADQTVVATDAAQTVSGFATNISAGPSDESGQTLTFTVTNDNNSLFSVQPDIDETTGDLTYTPDSSATGTATVTVVLKDDGGTANGGKDTSTTKTFKITVKPPNAAPVANSQTGGDAIAATEDGAPVTITLKATDADGDDLTFSIVDTPTKGSLGTIGTPDCTTTLDTCTATVGYTPAANENGSDSFTFKANDGTVDSNTATVEIAIAAVNDAPVATDDTYSVDEDTTLTVTAPGVLGNDTDVDGDALSVSRFSFQCDSPNSNGFVRRNADGSFSYTPRPNYNGPDSFGYRVNDGTADSNCATVRITVKSVNDLPVVDLDSEDRVETGIDTGVLFIERFTKPGFPRDTCCPVVLAPRTTVSDADDTMLESAEIKLTNHPDGNDESLSVDLSGTSIDTLGYDPETGILALFGPDTLANFQKVLRTVSYDNRSEPADHSDRLVTFKVNDGEADSQIATATVEVRCNQVDPTCIVP